MRVVLVSTKPAVADSITANTPVYRRQQRLCDNIFHQASDERVVIAAKRECPFADRLGSRDVVDVDHILRYPSLRKQVVGTVPVLWTVPLVRSSWSRPRIPLD